MADQQSPILWLCHRLLLLMLVGWGVFASAADVFGSFIAVDSAPYSSCETSFKGITYCTEDGGDIHIVIIDLDEPHIRFEMVMADDVTSVNTTHRERIEDMVNRPPYQDQQVVVAVNADYFGHTHGPEGLTVQNGRRLDGEGGQYQNRNALWRSSLAISRLNRVSLGRKSADELDNPRLYRERFFNAVGGGPLILNHGVVIPNAVACLLEQFPIGACRRKIQTAIGLSEDGRRLFLAVGEGRDIQGFARLLRDYGAYAALKLDGGGSSQLWYDGEMRHDTDRPVGNALFVFYSPVPRHEADWRLLSGLPVVEPGEHVEISFEIANTGFLDWESAMGYRFRNVQGWPILEPAYQRLPTRVPAGSSLASSWVFIAPQYPGVYEAEWQLVHRTEAIGPRLWFGIVVVPPGSTETGFKDQIESELARWQSRTGSPQTWSHLREELGHRIWGEVKAELREALADEDGRIRSSVETEIRLQWMPILQYLAW